MNEEANIVAVIDMLVYDYEILSMLTLEAIIGITLFKVRILGNVLRNSHKNFSDIMRCLLTIPFSGIETIYRLFQNVIGITYISYNIYRNRCYCYAKSPDLQ